MKIFKRYLNDDTIIIDYEYLWDIICQPNENLFPSGLNLIILAIPDNDITQKVDIICPSNHYANSLFRGKSPSALILLRDNFYEPILERQKIVRGNDKIKSKFSLVGIECVAKCPWSLQTVIRQIGKKISNTCKPIPPRPPFFGPSGKRQQREMKESISLLHLYKILKGTKYKISKQVINLHTKVIGVIVDDGKNNTVYVPISPSVININQALILANHDTSWWRDYQTTVKMLQNISELGRHVKKIPCKPIFKVIDDGKIIGILTKSNQFVPTKPNTLEDTHSDGLIPYYINANILDTNENIWKSTVKDQERLEMVKKIKLETNFYNTFRNTVRILLNQYKFKKIKSKIEKMIPDHAISYWQKLDMIIKLLQNLTEPFVNFAHIDINDIDIITTCLNIEESSCRNTKCCGLSADHGICQLIIPNINLISGNPNEKYLLRKDGR